MHAIFKRAIALSLYTIIAAPLAGCGGADREIQEPRPAAAVSPAEGEETMQREADEFLGNYLKDYAELELAKNSAYWKAANSGAKEDFASYAEAELANKKLHSDKQRFQTLGRLLSARQSLSPIAIRSLEVAQLAFKENQLPEEMLERMVNKATEIDQIFNTFRGNIKGKPYSNNELLEMLRQEKKGSKRKKIWQALKQVGAAVGPKLVELAKLRNEAAVKLGYENFWAMKVALQEYDAKQLLALFSELEQLTDQPFTEIKKKLDGELSRRFKVKPDKLMPWHYDNPFFQAPPPAEEVDLNDFYKDLKKEQIAELSIKFFADIGLPADKIVARSDLYEREGKDQHAFCIAIDRQGDTRVLVNLKPNADWMTTMLHELGHAVYFALLDFELPFNLRDPAHIFATEGVAMLFGALAGNPEWLVQYVGADKKQVAGQEEAIWEQRRRELLIFARWAMVMLHFEKKMYEDPAADLNKLWWDHVERFQLLKRPPERNEPDWAAKPHFTIAPVYYHNYLLGELFAAQLRHTLAQLAGHKGPAASLSFNGQKQFGEFLIKKVFKPSMTMPWAEFVKQATGEELTAKHFASEL